jgi:sugar lactone lactonase YvrE
MAGLAQSHAPTLRNRTKWRAALNAVGVAVALAVVPTQSPAATGDITTYEGGGAGDGLAATEANLNVPVTMLQDGDDLYIADSTNQRVRTVDLGASPPTIATLAGIGIQGSSPDGWPANDAHFYFPSGLAQDGAGAIYFSDAYNHRVVSIDSAGDIDLVAGCAGCLLLGDGNQATDAFINAPRGIAFDQANEALYIADTGHSRIRRVDLDTTSPTYGRIATVAGNGVAAYLGDGGPGALASLANPWGVAVSPDGEALYIADSYNHVVRKVDLDPASLTYGFISTVAGTGIGGYSGDGGAATSARLFQPLGVTADDDGVIYIADSGNSRVRKVSTTGTITTVAGTGVLGYDDEQDGGAATSAMLAQPFGVALDPDGDLLIADSMNHRIRRVDLSVSPPTIDTIAGNGKCCVSGDNEDATIGDLHEPRGMAADVDSDGALRALFIAGEEANIVRKVDSTGEATTAAGKGFACDPESPGDSGDATDANLCSPHDVAVQVDPDTGDLIALYIADTDRNTIRKVDFEASGPPISTVAGDYDLDEPLTPDHFDEDEDCGSATSAHLSEPEGVAVDSSRGILYIADTGHNRIRRVDLSSGEIGTVALNSCGIPEGGGSLAPASPPGSTSSSGGIPVPVPDLANGTLLMAPGDVEVDASRNLIYIADTGHNAIWRLDPDDADGESVVNPGSPGFSGDGDKAWNGQLALPEGLGLDPFNDRLFVADTYNHRVRKIDVDYGTSGYGDLSTVAGGPLWGFSGDGGAATSAELTLPEGVAASADDLYVADSYNHRVRKREGLP